MGEAYEALGPVEDKAPPPISPAAAPPGFFSSRDRPSSNAGQENADFGVVSGYISHSSGAQGNNPDNSGGDHVEKEIIFWVLLNGDFTVEVRSNPQDF
ncbi:unnamed protein product [Toxocara canis]|uniref:Uncharacterized protein n=1 Tax=Toxocara canis TaxID=6265 RepID=A0A183UR14_TOXCA|nr:unnamed protein product [Toxocara canis]